MPCIRRSVYLLIHTIITHILRFMRLIDKRGHFIHISFVSPIGSVILNLVLGSQMSLIASLPLHSDYYCCWMLHALFALPFLISRLLSFCFSFSLSLVCNSICLICFDKLTCHPCYIVKFI